MNKNTFIIALALCLSGCDGCPSDCDKSVDYPNPGSCSVAGAAEGSPGGKCRSIGFVGGLCDDALVCISSTCIPCGEDGQVCCAGDDCNGDIGCDHTDDKYAYCNEDCSGLGEACCGRHECQPSLLCEIDPDGASCEPAGGNPDCSGPNKYTLALIDVVSGCIAPTSPLTVNSTGSATAIACATDFLDEQGFSGQVELGPPNVPPTDYTLCPACEFEPNDSVYYPNYSAAQALSCAQHDFPFCAVTLGACPP